MHCVGKTHDSVSVTAVVYNITTALYSVTSINLEADG